jgi:hypothetical protein
MNGACSKRFKAFKSQIDEDYKKYRNKRSAINLDPDIIANTMIAGSYFLSLWERIEVRVHLVPRLPSPCSSPRRRGNVVGIVSSVN